MGSLNYESHLVVGVGTLSAFLLAADMTGFAPVPAPVVLAAGLGMAALGSIAVDIDHPGAFISSRAPVRLFKLGIRLLVFISIPAIITIASSRRVNLMEPDQLFQAEIFRLLAVVTIGAASLFALSRFVQRLFIHRGPIHAPAFFVGVAMVVTLLLALFVPKWWWMGLTFGWGWFTHLAVDGLTPRGVPLLWPLTSEKFSLLPGILLIPARFLVVVLSALSVVLLVARLIKVF
jgi:membrane-bound metal-dependent hydrolase YbcI (DUF457 family)